MPKKGTKPSGKTETIASDKKLSKTGSVSPQVKVNALLKAGRGKKQAQNRKLIEQMFNRYFYKLSHTKFIQLTKDWNEAKLEIVLPKLNGYDAWLNHFKSLSPSQIRLLAQTGLDILPTDGYAALSRWHDIISNPGRIDKIHKAGLTGDGDNSKSISELAEKNDRYGVLKAIRNQLANKMQNNPGNRDTADLAKQLTEVMTQIADYERRLAPDKKTVLGDLLSNMPNDIKPKRPSSSGGGARRSSFKSRVTIKDIEGN